MSKIKANIVNEGIVFYEYRRVSGDVLIERTNTKEYRGRNLNNFVSVDISNTLMNNDDEIQKYISKNYKDNKLICKNFIEELEALRLRYPDICIYPIDDNVCVAQYGLGVSYYEFLSGEEGDYETEN